MKRRYDIVHAVILILFLIIANFIGNDIFKGILLLIFSGILIFNTTLKLLQNKEDKIRDKVFYGILLFLDSVLALGSIYVIISAVIDAF